MSEAPPLYLRRLHSRAYRLHAQPDRLEWWAERRALICRYLFDSLVPNNETGEWFLGSPDLLIPVRLYRPTNAWHIPHDAIQRGPCLLSLAMWRWDVNPGDASASLTAICEGT